jgi:hypothetical protein
MQLHDIQVVLSSADAVNRFQNQNQQQLQAAQAQQAANINAQTEIKRTQSQQAENEQASKQVDDAGGGMHEWKKEDFEGGRDKRKQKEEAGLSGSADHIIDIRA